MSNVLSYRGYYATVEFDSEEGLLCGSVVGMSDGVYFEVETAAGVESAFHEAVDDYLSFCKEKGSSRRNPIRDRSTCASILICIALPPWPRPCGRNR